jgi:hypothetical protein
MGIARTPFPTFPSFDRLTQKLWRDEGRETESHQVGTALLRISSGDREFSGIPNGED